MGGIAKDARPVGNAGGTVFNRIVLGVVLLGGGRVETKIDAIIN